METCKHGSGAGFRKPAAAMRQGVECRAYRYLQNAAYLRLKNVVLGYTIPRSITEKVKISRLRVFVQGENLLTFTPLIDSYDPETLNNMTYPINKKISVGLNLTF